MQNKFRGVMQSPVTPLKDDFSLDLPTFERVLDFHVRSGAPAISWPHHKGESLNLTIAERKLFAEAAVKVVAGRVPVTIHASALAVEDTMALARHAQDIGADGILAITPYFWNPSLEAIEAYFVRLCSSIDLPVLSYNSPSYLAGVEITGDLMARLIEKLPNFVGVVDAGMDWVYMVEVISNGRKPRPDFQLLPATDYMVSARVMGGLGAFSALSAVAPKLVRQVYDACQKEDYKSARAGQEDLATLRHLLKHPRLETGLKVALGAMGRECGVPRPPVRPLGEVERGRMTDALAKLPSLRSEPRGW